MKKTIALIFGILILIAAWLWLSLGTKEAPAASGWPLSWNATPTEITERCQQAQATLLSRVNGIASTSPAQADWTSLLALEEALEEASLATSRLTFYSSVYPEKPHRDAAQECAKEQGKLYVDLFTRQDLFDVVEKAAEKAPDQPAEQILAKDYVRAFKNNGLHLGEEERAELVEIRKQMIDLASEYRERLNDWSESLWVTRTQLQGMPASFVEGLEEKDGKYKLTLKYPHYYPFMEMGEHAETRRQLQVKFMQRGGERNREILQEMLVLRLQAAKLLGYESHAQVVLEDRMAKDPARVQEFLQNLTRQLRSRAEQDLEDMVEFKRKELNDQKVDQIEPWDWRYYSHQVKKEKHSLDQEELAKYFPLNRVLTGMFEIYQTLFDVRFIEVVDAPKWHPSVKIYAVKDAGSGEAQAYFYMDLYPREGKYGHAAAFTLVSGRRLDNGSYQKPVAAIVANFTSPSASAPSLLKHDEVETLFHEFGHIMHQVLTRADYGSQSGTSVKRDFVEAPSQMLENWVWKKTSLAKLSGHYQTGEAIPDDMLRNLLASRTANIGIDLSRQAFLAQVDQHYHTLRSAKPVDTTAVWKKLQKDIMLVGIPEGTYPEASFSHLIGGYDAGYYGYLWSKVFAQDMFTQFEQNGLLDTKTGKKYLQTVLEPGGSRDPNELIRNFLGREPNQAAFLKSIGITDGAE